MGKAVDRKPTGSGTRRTRNVVNARSASAEKLSPAGSKIVSAFNEAIDAMRSGEPLEKRFSVRTYKLTFGNLGYGPADVRRVRALLGMSQAFFARFLGVDPNTIRSWEQGRRPPSPIARRFMGEIEENPAYWQQRVARSVVESTSGKSEG